MIRCRNSVKHFVLFFFYFYKNYLFRTLYILFVIVKYFQDVMKKMKKMSLINIFKKI